MTLATSLRFKLEEEEQYFSPALWFNLVLNKNQSILKKIYIIVSPLNLPATLSNRSYITREYAVVGPLHILQR